MPSGRPPFDRLKARWIPSTVVVLEKAGFQVQRQVGSHARLRHPDGRVVTVPIHAGQDIGRGLLRKILRDAKLSREEFTALLALHEEGAEYQVLST